jgi:hypothetical protein
MAAPNIVNVANIYAKTAYLTPSVNTAVVLIANPASSGKVLKINTIMAANIDGTNSYGATVALYNSGSASQGNAPSGGTAYPLVSVISVPAGATLNVTDKSTALYVEEGMSITVTSAAASKFTFIASYEELS